MTPRRRLDPRFAAVTRGVSLTVALVDSLTPQAKNLNADLTEMANVFMETRCVPIAAAARRSLFRPVRRVFVEAPEAERQEGDVSDYRV